MSVYVIADIEVTDPAGYEAYRQGVPTTVAAYGGRYLARGGATQKLDGDRTPNRCVILEFPSMEQFRAWWDSPEYQPMRAIRERTTRSDLVVTQGL